MTTDDTTYRGPDIPTPLGEQLRVVLGVDERPSTFGDYVNAMASLVERGGIEVDMETLCTTDESPHRATFRGQTQQYHCTLDALVVPFLAVVVERVEIETVSPVDGTRIAITVTESTVDAEPSDTVLSFGVAANVDPSSHAGESPALVYRLVCPYGKAFASHAEYDTWASRVDAYTMPLSLEDGLEFARALGQIA